MLKLTQLTENWIQTQSLLTVKPRLSNSTIFFTKKLWIYLLSASQWQLLFQWRSSKGSCRKPIYWRALTYENVNLYLVYRGLLNLKEVYLKEAKWHIWWWEKVIVKRKHRRKFEDRWSWRPCLVWIDCFLNLKHFFSISLPAYLELTWTLVGCLNLRRSLSFLCSYSSTFRYSKSGKYWGSKNE